MGTGTNTTFSLIIPTYNGAETLKELFAMLSVQTVAPKEVLVVDSSSLDNSVDIATEAGAEVTIISADEYDHGGTRALMAEKATGDLLIYMTQDAVPASTDALEKLLEPLMTDTNVAVSYGRQLPVFDANIFAAHLRYFNYPEISYVRGYDDRTRYGLRTVFTSNSFAAYRRSGLLQVGNFKNGLIFGEDTCTVGKLLKEGMKVAYVAEAKVYHSHNYSLKEEFRRSFDIGVLHSTEHWLIETYGKAEGEGVRYILSELDFLTKKRKIHLLPLAILRIGVKFLGYKLGVHFRTVPRRIVENCSLHKKWWARGQAHTS